MQNSHVLYYCPIELPSLYTKCELSKHLFLKEMTSYIDQSYHSLKLPTENCRGTNAFIHSLPHTFTNIFLLLLLGSYFTFRGEGELLRCGCQLIELGYCSLDMQCRACLKKFRINIIQVSHHRHRRRLCPQIPFNLNNNVVHPRRRGDGNGNAAPGSLAASRELVGAICGCAPVTGARPAPPGRSPSCSTTLAAEAHRRDCAE